MKVLAKTKNMSREEWLQWRCRGIGGSDVSIIAGINKFKSVYELWMEKTGQIETAETESENAHFGSVLEEVVKKEFMERTGLKVRAKHMLLQSEAYPFMIADLDGVINDNGEFYVFEAKTASEFKKEAWEQGVPPEYMLQIQHYMAVTGFKKTFIAALIGGNHFVYYEVERDEVLIEGIIAMEKYFWEVNVLQGVEPEADGSEATTRFLNEKYNESNGETVQLPDEALTILSRYDRVSSRIDELNKAKASLSNQLKAYLEDNEYGIVGDRKVSWKTIYKQDLDKKRLKEEQPDLYKEYSSRSSYRRLMVA